MKKLQHHIYQLACLFAASFCFSTAVLSMEKPEDESEKLWSELKAQKSLDKIYRMRVYQGKKLGQDSIDFLLNKCATDGHPVASLEIAEKIFQKKMDFTVVEDVETNVDCRENDLSNEPKINLLRNIDLLEAPTDLEYAATKELAKCYLTELLRNDEYKFYLPMMCMTGLGGLYPHLPFANKQSLTQEECNELLEFWEQKYVKSKQLFREKEYVDKEQFTWEYPTTPFWIQCLEKCNQDTEFFLLVNQALNKLNEYTTRHFLIDA